MRVAFYSTKPYDREFFQRANTQYQHEIIFLEPRLTEETASLAEGAEAVCVFVNDEVNENVLRKLSAAGVRLIALRSAGFNHVAVDFANSVGMKVVRVPAYSPHAVAEHTVALMLTLNRNIHRAYNRVREQNFALDGLLGFELHERVVGVIGTGKIGLLVGRILQGFGCRIVASDPYPSEEAKRLGFEYMPCEQLLQQADIVTLHTPLTHETHHIIDAEAIHSMRPGVMLINTSRGGLIDTRAVNDGLKSGVIGALGLDVYEEEADLFFEDLSNTLLQDDVFARLLTFPNVLITGHQGFFTHEALHSIAYTTLANISAFEKDELLVNAVQLKGAALHS